MVMRDTPVKFKRVTAPLDEMATARLCESSGSEHSTSNSPELSDLVDSFMEKGVEDETEEKRMESEDGSVDSDRREILESLLAVLPDSDHVLLRVLAETEIACRNIGTVTEEGFKRRLMRQLQDRGLDAGVCKSRWDKTGQFPAGDYEYIDVILDGARYIVEIGLVREFEIARPTSRYLSLLGVFPAVFVGKCETLKQVVRIMCASAKESMKSKDMYLPPWRRIGYVQGKWCGSYKRMTSSAPLSDLGLTLAGIR
ncbi:uncharacterized protein LOC143846955 [Tasmannia lanceolata]|uniref:uncharacterized protein LOC143846955 n=1 Tax=Tasmannia lanceolata TaxID=3420 RepID=UPI0040634656